MRVIHVVPSIAEEASGPSYSVRRLCQSLQEAGATVTLATLDWAPLSTPPTFLNTFSLGVGPTRLGRSPLMCRWLSQQCSLGQVHVLHNHGMWQMNAVYPAWAAKQGKVQLIYSPRGAFSAWAMAHGSRVKRIFWPLLQRPALRQANCFHATSEFEFEEIRQLGFRQPVAIIPNGVAFQELPPRHRPTQDRNLLFLSRLHKKKGLENLLRAWSHLEYQYPDWRLTIVGTDRGYHESMGYLEKLKNFSTQLELKKVYFLGDLYGEEKDEAYRQAELFVLPTFSENFGMVVAEALSLAIPAIVTKGAPWAGLVSHRAGWWIDFGVEPLVAALHEALSLPPEELSAMGQRGRLWMQKAFAWPSIGYQMAETYRWLCDRSLPVPAWVKLD